MGGAISVFVLSGRYGFISADQPIEDYDVNGTGALGHDLLTRQWVRSILPTIHEFSDVGLALNAAYLQRCLQMPGVEKERVTVISGSQGKRLSRLKEWLIGEPSETRASRKIAPGLAGPFRALDLDELQNRISKARFPYAETAAGWNALIGDRIIPAKKLASVLTEIPVSDFETIHALKLALALGLEVRRLDS